MNYLLKYKDQHKYDNVKSSLLFGNHLQNPKFTIMVPTFCRPKLLEEALCSALNQTVNVAYEIVVVDNDAQTLPEDSETFYLIKKINSSRIIYYKNNDNIGIYGNTLRAAQLAHGEYVALLNDDDLLHPDYLVVMEKFLTKYRYKGILGCQPTEFYSSDYKFPVLQKEVRAFHVSEIEFFFGCSVTSPGMMFPKKILYDIYNSYEELLMGDQIIQYKALKKYGLIFIGERLSAYRIAENKTLKENVLSQMIYHMLCFKKEISKKNFWLYFFSKLFYKDYCDLYIDSTLYFWKKRKLRKMIVRDLLINPISKTSLKKFIVKELMNNIRQYYRCKHEKVYDYVCQDNYNDHVC